MTQKQLIRIANLKDNHKKYRVRKKNKNRLKRLEDKWWTQSVEIAKWDYYLM